MTNATFINKDGKEIYRQPTSQFSRVMWYLSPLTVGNPDIRWWMEVTEKSKEKPLRTFRYNIGKRSEFLSRKYFSKDKAATHTYMDYDNSCWSLEFMQDNSKIINTILMNRSFVKQYA